MSGGHFEYQNDSLCLDITGEYPDYGERGRRNSKDAARNNKLEDAEISELVYDVFCLIHSYDWYTSGDTRKETYLEDVRIFKEKWFSAVRPARLKSYIDAKIEETRTELYNLIGVKEDTE